MTMVLFCAMYVETMMLINIKTSAWCKFASSKGLTYFSDVINVAAYVRRMRSHLRSFVHCISADQQLFDAILTNPRHVLHQLFAPISVASQSYMLRPRAHNRQITPSHLCNFINRMLYKNS